MRRRCLTVTYGRVALQGAANVNQVDDMEAIVRRVVQEQLQSPPENSQLFALTLVRYKAH